MPVRAPTPRLLAAMLMRWRLDATALQKVLCPSAAAS